MPDAIAQVVIEAQDKASPTLDKIQQATQGAASHAEGFGRVASEAFGKVGGVAGELGGQVLNVAEKFGTLAEGGSSRLAPALAGVALAGVGVGAVFVKLASDFEDATIAIQNQAGITDQAAAEIGQAMLDMGSHGTIGATDLEAALAPVAGRLELLTGTSLEAADAQKIMSVAEADAVASGQDLAGVTQGLTNIILAYGLSLDDANTVSDELYNTSRLTGTGIDELSTTISRLHARLGAATPSLEDLNTLMVALSVTAPGLGSRGLMQLVNALNSMLAPSDAVVAEMKTLGIVLYNTDGTFVGIQSTINQLAKAFEGFTPQQRRAAEDMLGLGSAAGILDGLIEKAPAHWNQWASAISITGTAEEGAQRVTESFSGQLETLKNKLEAWGADVGQNVLPTLANLALIIGNIGPTALLAASAGIAPMALGMTGITIAMGLAGIAGRNLATDLMGLGVVGEGIDETNQKLDDHFRILDAQLKTGAVTVDQLQKHIGDLNEQLKVYEAIPVAERTDEDKLAIYALTTESIRSYDAIKKFNEAQAEAATAASKAGVAIDLTTQSMAELRRVADDTGRTLGPLSESERHAVDVTDTLDWGIHKLNESLLKVRPSAADAALALSGLNTAELDAAKAPVEARIANEELILARLRLIEATRPLTQAEKDNKKAAEDSLAVAQDELGVLDTEAKLKVANAHAAAVAAAMNEQFAQSLQTTTDKANHDIGPLRELAGTIQGVTGAGHDAAIALHDSTEQGVHLQEMASKGVPKITVSVNDDDVHAAISDLGTLIALAVNRTMSIFVNLFGGGGGGASPGGGPQGGLTPAQMQGLTPPTHLGTGVSGRGLPVHLTTVSGDGMHHAGAAPHHAGAVPHNYPALDGSAHALSGSARDLRSAAHNLSSAAAHLRHARHTA